MILFLLFVGRARHIAHSFQLVDVGIRHVRRRQGGGGCVLAGGPRFRYGLVHFPRGYSQLPYRRSAVPRGVHKSYYRRSRSGGSAYNCQERSRRCCEQRRQIKGFPNFHCGVHTHNSGPQRHSSTRPGHKALCERRAFNDKIIQPVQQFRL